MKEVELIVEQFGDGTYEVRMRCVVSVKPSNEPGLHFAVIGRSTAYGCTTEEACAHAAARALDAEIWSRSRR